MRIGPSLSPPPLSSFLFGCLLSGFRFWRACRFQRVGFFSLLPCAPEGCLLWQPCTAYSTYAVLVSNA